MSDEPMPGTSSEDRALIERWRRESIEEPSRATAERIRAAARNTVAPRVPHTRRRARRTTFVSLAAAASVALLAVGLVRLIPPEQYQPHEQYRVPPAPLPEPPRDERRGSAVTEAESAAQAKSAPPRKEAVTEGPSDESFVPDAPGARAETQEKPRAARERAGVASDMAAQETDVVDSSPPPPTIAVPTAPAAVSSTTALHRDGSTVSAISPELATLVRNDAARRTGVVPDSITIVAVNPIAWRDASLRCEAVGDESPEARVPGYVVTVQASGTTLLYHTDGRDRVAICDAQ